MEFAWSVQEQDSNETSGDLQGRDSYDDLPANLLAIEADVSTQRVYRCVATNAVGTGLMCDIKVDGGCNRMVLPNTNDANERVVCRISDVVAKIGTDDAVHFARRCCCRSADHHHSDHRVLLLLWQEQRSQEEER